MLTTIRNTMITLVLASAALAGCGGPLSYAVKGSPKAPEIDAQITADVKKDEAMTTLKITIEHLAPPDRLGSGGKDFVVWSKGGEKPKWRRVGGMKYDDGKRRGSIDGASVPLLTFDLKITVEHEADADGPSSDVVLEQHVN